jgi:hypothetical protein
MLRSFLFVLLGIFLLIAGIPLMKFNFAVGLASIAAGTLVAGWFNTQFIREMIQWSVAKGEENREKRNQRKLARTTGRH